MASINIRTSPSQSLQDATPPTWEDDPEVALAKMRQDGTVHLVASVMRFMTVTEDIAPLAALVLPHLSRCSQCRSVVRQTLQQNGVPADHPAYALLEDADEGARWDAAGRNAAASAYAMLQSRGIGHVYGREGVVYRRRADGAEEVVSLCDVQDPA